MQPHPTNTRALADPSCPPGNAEPFHMGSVLHMEQDFLLSRSQIDVHMAVLGGSGTGKSKFLELLMRHFMVENMGFCFVDPHGDTAKDLLAFAAAQKALGNDELWRKVHYVRVGINCAVSYDPFAFAPPRGKVGTLAYDSWMRSKINRLCRALLRRVSEANLEVMKRLKKWLKILLYICGTAYDDGNTHIGMHKMMVFTDPADGEFGPLLDMVWKHLPHWVQNNLHRFRDTKSEVLRDKMESTVNFLVDTLSPLLEEVFAGRTPSLDVKAIIDEGGFLVVDMGETPDWDFDQKVPFGGMMIQEVLIAKCAEENLPPSQRKPFALIIDESGEFLGEDLQRRAGCHPQVPTAHHSRRSGPFHLREGRPRPCAESSVHVPDGHLLPANLPSGQGNPRGPPRDGQSGFHRTPAGSATSARLDRADHRGTQLRHERKQQFHRGRSKCRRRQRERSDQ